MGTRNCLMVVLNGEYKVAKYNQWDGYPTGVGKDIIKFIVNDLDINKFKEEVNKLTFCTEEDVDNCYKLLNIIADDGFISIEDSDRFNEEFPYLGRDMSSELLRLIQKGKVPFTLNSLEFNADSLFCEYSYLVNLDEEVLEIFKGFNTKPLNEEERFFFLNDDHKDQAKEYYPVKHLKTYTFVELKNMTKAEQLQNCKDLEGE